MDKIVETIIQNNVFVYRLIHQLKQCARNGTRSLFFCEFSQPISEIGSEVNDAPYYVSYAPFGEKHVAYFSDTEPLEAAESIQSYFQSRCTLDKLVPHDKNPALPFFMGGATYRHGSSPSDINDHLARRAIRLALQNLENAKNNKVPFELSDL